jgi:hypothetical protein
VQDYVAELIHAVDEAVPALMALDSAASARQPAPGKWSPREIIGHLVDSASNNHQRFVRAQFQDDLVFPGYDQDAWVALQHYADAPWNDLVHLWASFNHHIARLMAVTPEQQLTKPRRTHNLDELAWQSVPKDQPTTLEYFMRDYVGHLKHHLSQIETQQSSVTAPYRAR